MVLQANRVGMAVKNQDGSYRDLTYEEFTGLRQSVGDLKSVTATLTRAGGVVPYSVNDVIMPSTAGLMEFTDIFRALGTDGYIVGINVVTNVRMTTLPRLRLHFYNAIDPTLPVDNVAFKMVWADRTKWICDYDLAALTVPADATSGISVLSDNTLRLAVSAAPTSKTLWVMVETLDAFTPADAQLFQITLVLDSN